MIYLTPTYLTPVVAFVVGFIIGRVTYRRRIRVVNGTCNVTMSTHGHRHCGKARPCPDHEAPR